MKKLFILCLAAATLVAFSSSAFADECSKEFKTTFCPTGGMCIKCTSSKGTRYKLLKCKMGYTINDTKTLCKPDKCPSEYRLLKCPANATCDACFAGSAKKFQRTGCKVGYKLQGINCIKAKK